MPLLALGLAIGILSGVLGLGGGVFLVPALIFLFGFSQQQAQGTSLAVLVPPIGLFAALEYYRKGLINFSVVGFVCLGFVFGAFIGAFYVDRIPVPVMRRIFGYFMFFISFQMVFTDPDRKFGAIFPAVLSTAALIVLSILERRFGLVFPPMRRYFTRRRHRRHTGEYQI
ncbi:MAG: sulfite exporter TauE/SafE family protein [Candidatus Binatus sp.]|uniref:sulfite exporter TauE/SafE family protein n=1 Tax=Candidatus Binatus sp. TaxID=2811406 RepID=UPI002719FB76|nr:sulfite exporter TauE/SafE family protein [Candidatus Binatus sp.]MDO8432115.1 sulfite exporter TauE/SafE family protein [Candidatus Binatus sp.]